MTKKDYKKLPTGQITSLAWDKVTKQCVDVEEADLERKVAIIFDKENDVKEFRFFHEIECLLKE